MKYIPIIAGILLGLLFIMAAVVVLFHFPVPEPKFEPGSYPALFMGAFAPSGYLTFVKVCELLGGILVMVPKTRNFGLLVLGPIILNILAYHTFIMKGATLVDPMLIVICLLALYLLWHGRAKFAALAN